MSFLEERTMTNQKRAGGCINHPSKPVLARKMCSSCYQAWHYANGGKAKAVANAKKWGDAHKEKRRVIQAKSNAKGNIKEYKSLWAMMNKYNMTLEQYKALAKKQNNRCAICYNDGVVLNVDHCHDTGKVRGLLCSSCNRGLGFLGDTVKGVKRALDYLKGEH